MKAWKFLLYTPWAAMLIVAALLRWEVIDVPWWVVILPLLFYVLAVVYLLVGIWINFKNNQYEQD